MRHFLKAGVRAVRHGREKNIFQAIFHHNRWR